MTSHLGVLAFALSLTTCVGVAQERAARDESIGKGEMAGAIFEVTDGLASIRRLEPGVLTLWAQAPVLELRARSASGAERSWTLTIDNAMPDAILDVVTASGSAVAPIPLVAQRATEKRWTIALPEAVDTTLRLHPARPQPTEPWRFALLSDVQEAIDRVQDIYRRMNADPAIEFVVSAGDLTTFGTPEQIDRFQRELEQLQVPFFATLGNHELGTDDGQPFQHLVGRASFRFFYGGLEFIFLDSASATLDPRVYAWLDGWLAEGAGRTQVALMHVPPIDPVGLRNGSFADRNEAAKLLAKLAEGGVDLTLYGHIHSFIAFANAGIPAYIAGGGGAIPERFDGIGRHYLTVDVDPRGGILETGLVRIDGD